MTGKPLTILQITSSSNQGGGVRQAVLLSKGLRGAGHRVVFCAPDDSAALRWAREAGLEASVLSFGRSWGQWRASRALRALARQVGADVVHAHHTKAHNAALLATFGGGFPPVVANRGVLFRPEFPAKFRSRRTSAVITNSLRVKQVLGEGGVPSAKIHVVYNAKELPEVEAMTERLPRLRRELDLEVAGPVVGTVGRAKPEKGFQFLVEAAPAILQAFPEAWFVLVGGGTERFIPRLRELGIQDRFRLPGYRSDAADVMALFDVFAFPSIDMDSCPNVVLEAMAAGVPVVGADVGGVAEIVVDGATGKVVPPGDSKALSLAVVGLLAGPACAREMGAKGRERVASRFSLDEKVGLTLAVYEEVMRS